ncbi:hypothetical protein [Kitasatospora griseola]|uniref:hypothetical protein n=1 Tax=Kitasatospora griseola TaxID=2064 RepID=UPI0034207CFF
MPLMGGEQPTVEAVLRGAVALPGGRELVNGFGVEGRAGSRRAVLRDGARLAVFDLDAVFDGRMEPSVVFPLPWPGWTGGVHTVSPDGSFAVFSGQRAVRAVNSDGTTRWEYPHPCWGPELGHPHSGDEQEVCAGSEQGSCWVSDDGRVVWAHTPGPSGDDCLEEWVVLDAVDGRPLARQPLESVASASHHRSHPDSGRVGLCVGMGQDGVGLYWAHWDGERLRDVQLDEAGERILMDVHPDRPTYLTVDQGGWDVQLHGLDGTTLAEGAAPPAADPDDPPCWDWYCGFVDPHTVLASTLDCDDDHGAHWLLDTATLTPRHRITYPDARTPGYARPLGDGTWLTFDDRSGLLHRWSAKLPMAGDEPAAEVRREPAGLLMTTERGLSERDPGPTAISRQVAALRCGDPFLIVERTGGDEPGDWYVQVRYLRDGERYELEYRDGVPSEHHRTVTDSPAAVVGALVGWSAGLTAWRRNFDWTPIGHWFTG